MPLLLSGCFLAVYVLILIFVIRKLRAIEKKLHKEAYGEKREYERSGIFKEIWDEYEYNQFEGIVDFKTKCEFIGDYNNSIDLTLIRNRHEFNILIDETCIYFITDEESDSPIEQTVNLSEFNSLSDFYNCISNFVFNHS